LIGHFFFFGSGYGISSDDKDEKDFFVLFLSVYVTLTFGTFLLTTVNYTIFKHFSKPHHISESVEAFFWVKILKFFDAIPG
jgi:hypothetical protein